jgi:serine/threonine protein phosphatase PrpC
VRTIAKFTTPKTWDETVPNEDAYCIDEVGLVAAVSDGASESFDSARWSRILAEAFVALPRFSSKWLSKAIQEYEASTDFSALPWYAEAAHERGSFATLLGAYHRIVDNKLLVFSIGDSLAILTDGKRLVRSFPYQDAHQFENQPLLLSTRSARNEWLRERYHLRDHLQILSLYSLREPRLLLMTDAIGAWALGDPEGRISMLLDLTDQNQFVELVDRMRSSGEMRRDDSTLLVFAFDPP